MIMYEFIPESFTDQVNYVKSLSDYIIEEDEAIDMVHRVHDFFDDVDKQNNALASWVAIMFKKVK